MIRIHLFLTICVSFFICESEGNRRLGKLNHQSWSEHFNLARNQSSYLADDQYPDFSPIGALVSNEIVGTATLIAPNLVVSAAHVVKNSLIDPMPDPEDWTFVLSENFESASTAQRLSISQIIVHPGWIARQTPSNRLGDGDRIGVDLCLAFLDEPVSGIYPMPLPFGVSEEVGQKVFIAGFGTQVDGVSGIVNSSNSNRLAGENILDRVVESIPISTLNSNYWGGVLAVDFDSPQKNTNFLGNEYGTVDYLGTGDSDPNPLSLEVSTAVGDSGGPIIIKEGDRWKIHGVVSYGTNDSFYGDITVFTRLASHQDWIKSYLPTWSEAKAFEGEKWRQSIWFGIFLPSENGWNYHSSLGWLYCSVQWGDSIWVWRSDLGWIWSDMSLYPFFYSANRSGWIFVDTARSNPYSWQIFCYEKGIWEQVDHQW